MDDYSALAQRISVSVSGVSGALILSRDGMVLGAYPDDEEGLAKPAWLRFITLGEPEKSFVEFPDQVWAYVRRGPYAAFATAEAGTRPGVLVDQMEQALLIAEEGRARRDTLRVPDSNAAPSGKPRTSLHPQGVKPPPAEVGAEAVEPAASAEAQAGPAPETQEKPSKSKHRKGGQDGASSAGGDGSAAGLEQPSPEQPSPEPAPPEAPPSALKKEPQKLVGKGSDTGFDEDAEVDRVLLAKEFSGLLQVDSGDDEGSS